MRLSVKEVAEAVKGQIINNDMHSESTITKVYIDSRETKPGGLFVPLQGERDGHDFIEDAFAKGAVCSFSEKPNPSHNGIIIKVESTRRALMDLGAYYRRKHNVKVIGITGSAGKTTTKEMIAQVLERKYKTKKTIGNYNNDIGMPLSIFQLTPEDEVLVLEMGMNHAGEITKLSQAGAPDIAVITNIGDAHIENFSTGREGILRAKLELLDGLAPNGTVVLNGDDPLLTGPYANAKAEPFKKLYPRMADIKSMDENNIAGGHAHFVINGQDIHINLPLPGAHMVFNALIAATVAMEMGLTPTDITQGFDNFTPPGGRLSVMEIGGMTVINDVYNANPASVQEAIKVVVGQDGRKVCILGGMNELGSISRERHKEIGNLAAEVGINVLVTVGTTAWWINEGFYDAIRRRQSQRGSIDSQPMLDETAERLFDIPKRTVSYRSDPESTRGALDIELGKLLRYSAQNQEEVQPQVALHYETVKDFLKEWQSVLRRGDIVLIKASRNMAFEDIINGLKY